MEKAPLQIHLSKFSRQQDTVIDVVDHLKKVQERATKNTMHVPSEVYPIVINWVYLQESVHRISAPNDQKVGLPYEGRLILSEFFCLVSNLPWKCDFFDLLNIFRYAMSSTFLKISNKDYKGFQS